jgi:hypothetical protein
MALNRPEGGMKFRLGYAASFGRHINPLSDPLRIAFGDDHGTQVTFRRRTSEELERKPSWSKDIVVIAEGIILLAKT